MDRAGVGGCGSQCVCQTAGECCKPRPGLGQEAGGVGQRPFNRVDLLHAGSRERQGLGRAMNGSEGRARCGEVGGVVARGQHPARLPARGHRELDRAGGE